MTAEKAIHDLIDDALFSGAWKIDGQDVDGFGIQSQGPDSIELLELYVAQGPNYLIKGHASLMKDLESGAMVGWVMDLTRGRQVYLSVKAKAKVRLAAIPQDDVSPAQTAENDQPAYDVVAARTPIPDSAYEAIEEIVPQEGLISDGQLDQWLDEETAPVVTENPQVEEEASPAIKPVKSPRRRLSEPVFQGLLMTWSFVFFVVFMACLVSLCMANESRPWGPWPVMSWVTLGMIALGYLLMWMAPPDPTIQRAQDSGNTETTP